MALRILDDPIRKAWERHLRGEPGEPFDEVVRREAERSRRTMLENCRRRIAEDKKEARERSRADCTQLLTE